MADLKPFQWGIVGTGGIARQFRDDLRHIPDARLSAVCSRSMASAKAFANDARIATYTDFNAFLADQSIDAVYLATPNHLHASQALRVIAAKRPVLVEKPVATTSADAEAIFTAAGRQGVFAMEALWSRFLPAVQEAKRLIDAGTIGKPLSVQAELSYRRDPVGDDRFFDPNGGGAALDLGVYPLSLTMLLFGAPERVAGRWWRGPGGVDMRTEFDLTYGGVQARLACGFDRDGDNVLTISGSEGALRLNRPFLKAKRITLFGKAIGQVPILGAGNGPGGLVGKILDRVPVPGRRRLDFDFPGGGLQFEAEAVMALVRQGKGISPISPPEHSVAVLKAIETVLSQSPAN